MYQGIIAALKNHVAKIREQYVASTDEDARRALACRAVTLMESIGAMEIDLMKRQIGGQP